ncbi:hypothetical protein HK097_000515 [Rhizophlyctis rosea]|uniref:Major facilitator superfamily (MFS) profile domain-containing protein n=1 Tax=Rhizophlyctis rosea TaxID=64517 RepID=A0AAD5WZF8_9FUNG|nr:hypothetical protein HK097_000515 [Rhizophlyctis rosea]
MATDDSPPPVDDDATILSTERTLLLSASTNLAPTTAPTTAPTPLDKPLPKLQILLLCYARMVEPIAFFSIFPYINKMAQENGSLPTSDVGFYSGLIESLFSLTQMLVMLFWGKAADRIGRKPVLVFSLFGVSIATSLFGLAKTIPQMILFRCVAGVFAGTIVTIRTMISEHSTTKTQARSFSWFAFAGNLGIFVGPLIGGALADPAEQYPGVFGDVAFFKKFPYALSSFVVGFIGLTTAITSALFIKETLPKRDSNSGPESGTPAPVRRTTLQLLKSPGVGIVLYVYAHVMLLAFAYTAIVPVFWFTPIPLGGFSFTPIQISLFMALTGAAQSIWLLLIFPPLQHRIGTKGIMRLCASAYPFFFIFPPLLNLLLRNGEDLFFWVVFPPLLCVGLGVSMSFTGVQLGVNDVCPEPQSLGQLNALSLTGVSALRAVVPAVFSSAYAVGVRTQWVWGYAVWVLLVALAVGFRFAVGYWPDDKKVEGGEESGIEVDGDAEEQLEENDFESSTSAPRVRQRSRPA